MKPDVYSLILKEPVEIHPKRLKRIHASWEKQGWDEKKRDEIRELILNKRRYIYNLSGRVVFVTFRSEKMFGLDRVAGILQDYDDNGWTLYCRPTDSDKTKLNTAYSVIDWNNFENIAYFELHPNPNRIWKDMNHTYWKYNGQPDRYHQKITTFTYDTAADYSRASLGIITYSNPRGNIGDCEPRCQCKHLTT